MLFGGVFCKDFHSKVNYINLLISHSLRKGGRETGPEDRMPQRRPGKPDRQTSSVVIFAQASERLNKPSQRVREIIMTSKEAMAEEMRLKLHIEDLEKKQQAKLMMLAKKMQKRRHCSKPWKRKAKPLKTQSTLCESSKPRRRCKRSQQCSLQKRPRQRQRQRRRAAT